MDKLTKYEALIRESEQNTRNAIEFRKQAAESHMPGTKRVFMVLAEREERLASFLKNQANRLSVVEGMMV